MAKQMDESDFIENCEIGAGFCTHCMEITVDDGLDPDAENIKCNVCLLNNVVGMENALIMELIEFK